MFFTNSDTQILSVYQPLSMYDTQWVTQPTGPAQIMAPLKIADVLFANNVFISSTTSKSLDSGKKECLSGDFGLHELLIRN
jgi:hypothetical protein